MAHSPSYWNIPVQTEKERQYLSEFQSKNLLNDQIDYLLDKENWIPTEWDKTTQYGTPAWNYGQKIADPDALFTGLTNRIQFLHIADWS